MTDILKDVVMKMKDYNSSPKDEILLSLIEKFYLPYVQKYEENYTKNLSLLPKNIQADFPLFSNLPIYLFSVTEEKSFILDLKQNKFIIENKESIFYRLLRLLLQNKNSSNKYKDHLLKYLLEEKKFYYLAKILTQKIEQKRFDHEYFEDIEKLAVLHASKVDVEYLKALYFFSKGQKKEAYEHALLAYEQRQSNTTLLALMIKFASLNKKYADAAYYTGLYFKKMENFDISILQPLLGSRLDLEVLLDKLGLGLSAPVCPPIRQQISLDSLDSSEEIKLSMKLIPYVARKLIPSNKRSYIAGLYNQDNIHYIDGEHIDFFLKMPTNPGIPNYKNFHFDLFYAEKKKNLTITKPTTPILLPIASTVSWQEIEFDNGTTKRKHQLGKYEYEFFRINEDVKISSKEDLIIGEPIKTGHSKKRKKLVLNLMLDALSWRALRQGRLDYIPNIMRFFSKGVIFDNHYSLAEYTYPSVASMESGMYMHSSQIIANMCANKLSPKYLTLSEQMKNLGYFTANIASDGQGVLNEAYRGYDRIIINHYSILSANCVDRTILHLDAFADVDAFYYVHFFDTHCNKSDMSSNLVAQTSVNLHDRIVDERDKVSVHARPTIFNQTMNLHRIKMTDIYLGILFDYIEKHYQEDEYIVTLYSDHGCSIYTPRDKQYLLSDEQVGATLMLRGAGVPKVGIVKDELTSSLDIYKILGKLVGFPIDSKHLDGNLPQVFGGKKREYTISNSIFPGQTSKFCVRTLDYECRLETESFTATDFTTNLSRYKLEIFTRDEKHLPVYSDEIREYFLNIIENHVKDFRNDKSILPSP